MPTYQRHDLIGPGANATAIREGFSHLCRSLNALSPQEWNVHAVETALEVAAAAEGIPFSTFKRALRIALGSGSTSRIAKTIEKMGQQECLSGIQMAIDLLSVVANAQ